MGFFLLREKRWLLIFSIVMNACSTILFTLNSLLVSRVADDVLKPMFGNSSVSSHDILMMLLPFFIAAVALTLARSFASYYENMLREKAFQVVVTKLRNEMYAKVSAQTRSFFLENRSGDLLNKCTADVDRVGIFVGRLAPSFCSSFFMLLVVLVVFFSVSWKFTLCELALTPVIFITTFFPARRVRPIFANARQQLSRLNTVVQENISGNRVVRAFAREPFEIQKFQKENIKYSEMELEGNKAWVRYSPIMETVSNMMNALAVIVGSLLAIFGEITIGQLLIFTGMAWMLNAPMSQLGFLINDLQRFTVSSERVHELYDSLAEIRSSDTAVCDNKITGDIRFDHVSLRFDDKDVLKDVSFHIPAGSSVGIMGPTGAGKSTIINLVSRFYNLTSGEVRIDGYNIADMTLKSIRSQMGIMLQDTFIFSGSIIENIRYGRLDATDEECIEAAKKVHAHEFISQMPKGYYTEVDERGDILSAGQRQLLSFARTMLSDPRILILDEATSSIDTNTEILVQQGIKELLKNRTSFIVAHRLSTIKGADCIMYINGGVIAEAGTHDELLEQKGLYYHLYTSQLSAE